MTVVLALFLAMSIVGPVYMAGSMLWLRTHFRQRTQDPNLGFYQAVIALARLPPAERLSIQLKPSVFLFPTTAAVAALIWWVGNL